MNIRKTELEGVYVITPDISLDKRGFFYKSFQSDLYRKKGLPIIITQVNHSLTKQKGTIRGMHFQKRPFEEAKIVECLKGKIYDVVIDLRKKSKTFGKWRSEELSSENKKALFIPKGFAHGFQTLENDTRLLYLMTSRYSLKHSSGVRFDDPFFAIRWPLKPTFLAKKDKTWPFYTII